jgi:hypothetical protein
MAATTALEFPRRGYRRRKGHGLSYRSRCGRYEVYQSCMASGVAIPEQWLAIEVTTKLIISRHRLRERAERACELHLRKKRREI